MAEGSAVSSVTFFSKQKIECPVCGATFNREEMRTGRGRLNAGELTLELRRQYIPTTKYGEVYPLNYPVTTCPVCYYSALHEDFDELPPEKIGAVEAETEDRQNSIAKIFSELDFREPRTLKEGVASYYFAVSCYDHMPKQVSPTIKQGISSLRAAWLLSDLHRKYPDENYDYISNMFYRKARFFYVLSVEYESDGKESLTDVRHLGPDLDKNYGYDGVLYLSALLEYRYGPKDDPERRAHALTFAKRTVARIVGMGRASKSKPSALLDMSRDVHAKIREELKEEDEE